MNNKKVLLIAPSFYNYYVDIANVLQEKGYIVEYYSDQIKYSIFGQLLNKIFKHRSNAKMDRYIDKIVKKNKLVDYELFLLINGKNISESQILKIIDNINTHKRIYFAWDSVANFPNIRNFVKYFDKACSFDKNDCLSYNFSFLPLFFVEKCRNDKRPYDYSSIMNVYPNKIDGVKKVFDLLPNSIIGYKHLRIKSRLTFYYYKFKYKNFKLFKKNDFKYYNLTRHQCYEIFKESKVVLDIPLNKQTGLTMRTFEALAMGCKLITTNENIYEYDFFNEKNIFVVRSDTCEIPLTFFNTPFDLKYEIDDKYSVHSFVTNLIDNSD